MAKYQKYTEYKDSGVEWLGKIPSHWNLKRFKHHFRSAMGETILGSDLIDDGKIPVYSATEGNHFFGYVDASSVLLEKGDIVIPARGNSIGFPKLVESLSTCSQTTIYAKKIKNIDSQFVFYYLLGCKPYLFQFVQTAIPQITVDEVKNNYLICPQAEEQLQIVSFLDHETSKIDTLIAKQEKLIELLKEKRQAVISHAVTKGLNPNVPMKDSGVEWLGEVPEHWDVCKIQYYAKIESGHTPSKTNEKYWENCTIPWVSLNDSKQLRVVDYITDTKYQISELGLANSSARILPKETVVFTRDASIGLSAITTREMAVSQHLIAWLPNKEKLSPEFLLLIFYAMEKEFNRYTFGSTIKTIGMDDVRSLMASFPPLAEQLEIVSRSFSQFELIDTSIEKSNCLLNILKERRTALISAAVTGKIDVRDWRNPNKNKEADMELSA